MSKIIRLIADNIILAISLAAAYAARHFFPPLIQPFEFYWPLLVFALAVLFVSFAIFRIYANHRPCLPAGRPPLSFSYLVDFLRALALWGALIVAFAFFTKTDYSRAVVILFFIFSVILLFINRLIIARKQNGRGGGEDRELWQTINQIVKISALSSDDLALLEGVRRARAPSGVYFLLKRLLDILGGLLGLILTLLFYLLIIWLVKKDGPGPVIIKQERVGLNGRKFILYKFRTMRAETELYAAAPRRGDDPRITKTGRWLRKYSLDELPQFWNVLRGEMSLVGPRPEMPFIVAKYTDWQKMRLSAKPGITGLWQILGRKDRPLEENIEYDLYYIFHQSFFLDLAILLRTVPHLVFPRGAY